MKYGHRRELDLLRQCPGHRIASKARGSSAGSAYHSGKRRRLPPNGGEFLQHAPGRLRSGRYNSHHVPRSVLRRRPSVAGQQAHGDVASVREVPPEPMRCDLATISGAPATFGRLG